MHCPVVVVARDPFTSTTIKLYVHKMNLFSAVCGRGFRSGVRFNNSPPNDEQLLVLALQLGTQVVDELRLL